MLDALAQNQRTVTFRQGERQLVGAEPGGKMHQPFASGVGIGEHGIERTAGIDDSPLVVGRLRARKAGGSRCAIQCSLHTPRLHVVPECDVGNERLGRPIVRHASVLDLFLFQERERVQQTGIALLQLGSKHLGFVRHENLFGYDRADSVYNSILPDRSATEKGGFQWRKQNSLKSGRLAEPGT